MEKLLQGSDSPVRLSFSSRLSLLFLMTWNLLQVFVSVLIVCLLILIAVAYLTVMERKLLAAVQRRVGPNTVGAHGLLQAVADALKLIVKSPTSPSVGTSWLFGLAPVVSLVVAFMGWAVFPIFEGGAAVGISTSVLIMLGVVSLGVFGMLYSGWASGSAYALLGSLRSGAQMISYELVLSTGVYLVLLTVSSFSLLAIGSWPVWVGLPLFVGAVFYLLAALAETSRPPFDLPEAESELVAGFFVEYGALLFVMFFLAEYTGIAFQSGILAVLYLGGAGGHVGLLGGAIVGVKLVAVAACFILARAALPRLRYDQLMTFGWVGLLVVLMAATVVLPLALNGALTPGL